MVVLFLPGAGLGCYPNGLRVLRDISPDLLQAVRDAGYSYQYRRWERHDGSQIAEAEEAVLSNGEEDLNSIGIRRWQLQKVLYEYAQSMGIEIHFSKGTVNAEMLDNDLVRVHFADGTSRLTRLLFGCDGGKSAVRNVVAPNESELKYTGVTCLSECEIRNTHPSLLTVDSYLFQSSLTTHCYFYTVGLAKCTKITKGISFPSSDTKDFHAVFFPTGLDEQCFQFHFPIIEEEADKLNWGNLSQTVGQEECHQLAVRLRAQGWHERFLEPLEQVTHAVRVGFALLEPKLTTWVRGRMVLCGDAAHPPVPYIGQGAQQGMEDVGVCVTLLKHFCYDNLTKKLDLSHFTKAMNLYQKIRVQRSGEILAFSKDLGGLQAARSGHSEEVVSDTELMMKGDILMYGTLPIMFHGADHDYKLDTDGAIEDEKGVVRVTEDEALAAWEALFYGESPKDDDAVSPDEALAAFEAIHFGIQPTQSPRSSLVV